jgi:hypothetical protein
LIELNARGLGGKPAGALQAVKVFCARAGGSQSVVQSSLFLHRLAGELLVKSWSFFVWVVQYG